jgi:hypothetical protein
VCIFVEGANCLPSNQLDSPVDGSFGDDGDDDDVLLILFCIFSHTMVFPQKKL